MRRNRLRVSGGFWLLLAVLFWLDDGVGLLVPALLACVLHELGHLLAIRRVGVSVKCISLTAVGAEMVLEERKPLSYGQEFAVALAGPLASLLCAWVSVSLRCYLTAAMCLGQGAFNLLPIRPMDGGRALYALLAHWNEGWAERVLTVTSALCVGTLLGLGGILLSRYGNPTLAITALWLLGGIFRRNP